MYGGGQGYGQEFNEGYDLLWASLGVDPDPWPGRKTYLGPAGGGLPVERRVGAILRKVARGAYRAVPAVVC